MKQSLTISNRAN